MIEIDNVWISGGVNEQGARSPSRRGARSSVSLRCHRRKCAVWRCSGLAGAEAAEQDAAVMTVLRRVGLSMKVIAAVIADMRDVRSKPPFDTTGA